VGCDVAAAAVQVSGDNARRLHLPNRVAWVQGSTEALRPPFHLIVANLPFQIQMAKREELVRLCHHRGALILSGFRDTQEEALTDTYLAGGWRRQRRLIRDLWELELPAEKSYTWVGLYLVR
jgi:ribosomal protein L11 methylase PrmA